jgi:hypothetical protein
MSTAATLGARGWALAAGAAAVVGLVVLALFHAPPVSLPTAVPAPAAIPLRSVSEKDARLSEEAQMRDLAPLFLPTERNARVDLLPRREPGGSLLVADGAKHFFREGGWDFAANLPPLAPGLSAVEGENVPVDLILGRSTTAPLLGFGRSAAEVPAFAARGAYVEVASTDGRRVLSEALPVTAAPQTDKLWQPLEFLAAVDAAGLVAPLSFASRSGVEEVDAHYRNYLVRTFRIGERLAPGFYRITVAP